MVLLLGQILALQPGNLPNLYRIVGKKTTFWFTNIIRAYIANRVSDKLTKVTDRIYCCRSGSAADTQAITAVVQYHLNFHA